MRKIIIAAVIIALSPTATPFAQTVQENLAAIMRNTSVTEGRCYALGAYWQLYKAEGRLSEPKISDVVRRSRLTCHVDVRDLP